MKKTLSFSLLIIIFAALVFLLGCGKPTDTEINEMLIALSHDYYEEIYAIESQETESEKLKELKSLLAGVETGLITGYNIEKMEVNINMHAYTKIAEEGKTFLEKTGKENLKNILSENFEELLVLLENEQWDKEEKIKNILDRLKLANFIGFTNFNHLEVLESFFTLNLMLQAQTGKTHKSDDIDNMMDDSKIAMCLRKIPDDYAGPLNKQILFLKRTIAPTSELYMAMKEIEETIEILKEFEEIKITEWKWHIDRNYAYLEGKIKNNHSIPISYVKVEVVYEDKNEDILDTDWTYAVGSHPLQPGHVKSFSMMTPYSDGMEKAYIEVVSFRKN
jgi:hypothetical protein